MSFLGLRKSRHHLTSDTSSSSAASHVDRHLDDHHHLSSGSSTYVYNSHLDSGITRTPSIKSTSTSFRQRLSSFNVFSSKRIRSTHSNGGKKKFKGVGLTASYNPSSSYAASRSPSPEPSLEIRRPSGLGRRASITGEEWWAGGEDEKASCPRPGPERKRSISTPELSLSFAPTESHTTRWSAHSETVFGDEFSPLKAKHKAKCVVRLPVDLLKAVLEFVPREDMPVVARTCKTFLEVARVKIYQEVGLLEVSDRKKVDKCINVLASKRDIAGVVECFSCDALPSSQPSEVATSPLPAVSFAIALNNMHTLNSLTLARFDSALLFHATFQLRELTFLCSTAPQGELEGLFAWLTNQSTLTSLSFPHLILDPETSNWLAGAGSQLSDIPEDQEERNSSSYTLPLTLLPALQHVCGPAPLIVALAPGRPLSSVMLRLYTTIYDGLRPSALVAELARSTASVASLTVVAPPESRVDARTIERVIMAAGAELGAALTVLEIETSQENQVSGTLACCASSIFC